MSTKMKRVNKEHISTVIQDYFKRRNYSSDPLSHSKQSQSLITNVITMAVDAETSSLGVINLGCVAEGHSPEFETQFSRLVLFVKEAPEKHKQPLMQILFPIFISIYVDLLVAGLKPTANKFHLKNKTIFGNLPIYKTSMETIAGVVQKCDRDRTLSMGKMLHTELGENKFSVTFTTDTLNYLLGFLSKKDNTMILQIFNSNLSVEIATDNVVENTTSSEPLGSPPITRTVHDEASITSLKSAIDRMRGVTPPLPSIRFNAITTFYPQVICGTVTDNHIIFGCNDSSVRISSKHGLPIKRASLQPGSCPHTDISTIHLNGDWLEDIETTRQANKYYEAQHHITMRGHSSDVYDVAVLDESQYILSCSADKTIRLWDTKNCINRVIYSGHTQTVWGLATSHQCSYFASASKDRTARLWTTERTYPIRQFAGHTLAVDCVKFHPNNSYIATGSQDKTVRLWSIQDGKCVRLMQGHRSNVLSLAFSPNGKYLASAGEDRRIRLWDLSSGELIKELKGHNDIINCLEFNSDGSVLCSGGQDNVILCWDTRISPNATHNDSSNKTPATASDVLASITTHDCNVLSLRCQNGDVIDAMGVST